MFETVKSLEPHPQADSPGSPIDLPGAESRLDALTGKWTVFAPGRHLRPEEIVSEGEATDTSVACPFCVGHEDQTPSPVWIGHLRDTQTVISTGENVREAADDDWSVRVVPNKYPAVQSIRDSGIENKAVGSAEDHPAPSGLFQRETICGGHEVIVESRQHVQSISALDLAEVELVFRAYRDRLTHWRGISGVSFLSVFKNVGGRAGASLRHSHSQLIAADKMPQATRIATDRMVRHRSKTGCCLQCDLIRAEQKANKRIVWQDDSLIALCPFSSRLPMMLRVTSLAHQGCFEDLKTSEIDSVARLVQRAVAWLEKIRPETAYNYYLHTRPPGLNEPADSFHWAIDLFPRMTQVAGFEWSSDCMINPILPEKAAVKFRVCARAEDPRRELR